ncbi:hypothetical protein X737_30290 [Mesorhizobium sp. L48C026A00]|nr:hypothetical protein X737_30290 [Mesorhizobium sp. L48C026A00]
MKELRLRSISTIEAANAYAAEFAADFNARFGNEPRNPKDMHRPLANHENLDGAMCRKEFRTLSQALTLRYDKVLFILDPSPFAKSLAGKKARPEIVENKRLDEALAMVAEMQAGRELTRSQDNGYVKRGAK